MTVKHNIVTFLILGSIFLLSIGSSYIVPTNDLLKGVLAAPGVVALLAALFQLIRDEAAFERKRELQQDQMRFTLGAASHMASSAFDKHVEFCEKYMVEINAGVRTLFREGETPEALRHAGALFTLRQEYSVWLTDSMNANLEKFEGALRKLGAQAHFVRNTQNAPQYADQRIVRIQENADLFNEILDIGVGETNEDHAVESMKRKLRAILGVEELTKLREHLVREASVVIEKNA